MTVNLIAFLDARLDEEGSATRAALVVGSRPVRSLREIVALRAIVALYEQQAAKASQNAMEEDRAWILEPVLGHLATIWGDHPDYDQEWKP